VLIGSNYTLRVYCKSAANSLGFPPGGKKGKPGRGTLVESYRERELIYQRTHADELLQYAGRWIALEGEVVVASSSSLIQTIADARSRGIKIPYVFYVSADETAELGL
jgi:hypothetical protein